MNLDERELGLLKLVEDYRDSECRDLIEAARSEARDLIGRTYRAEHKRLHERIVTERAGAQSRIHAARAECDTRRRAGGERANARLLAAAWPRLEQRLMDLWQDANGRRAWVRQIVDQASRVLPDRIWTLRHAPDWPPPEWQALAVELTGTLGAEPRLVADGSIRAGVSITSGGALLDGSLDGLLRDRVRIEARLLDLLSTGAPS